MKPGEAAEAVAATLPLLSAGAAIVMGDMGAPLTVVIPSEDALGLAIYVPVEEDTCFFAMTSGGGRGRGEEIFLHAFLRVKGKPKSTMIWKPKRPPIARSCRPRAHPFLNGLPKLPRSGSHCRKLYIPKEVEACWGWGLHVNVEGCLFWEEGACRGVRGLRAGWRG
jgi:hypothetical protein